MEAAVVVTYDRLERERCVRLDRAGPLHVQTVGEPAGLNQPAAAARRRPTAP